MIKVTIINSKYRDNLYYIIITFLLLIFDEDNI